MNKIRTTLEIRLLIKNLHPVIKKKIKAGLDEILLNPESGKYLKKELSGLQSYKVGKFRIIYRKSSSIIELISIGPRKNIYQETARLIKQKKSNGK